MCDRRLEAITAAAELGSFSRAAAKLRVSTPALVKQVSGFEAEFGITLFERSHSGVKVTSAGALPVDDARSIMRQSEDALRRARRAAGDGGAVRLGVSMMCPGRQTLSMWTDVHPAFVGVPFLCGREVPVVLHYPLEPTLQVQQFVNAMAQLLNS